ncbi:MAG: signal peptidase II [Spirochaetales bacterium]|jgi:signal peptidase II|nr:signal peptidase II [Spirochaetales bacterium]
MNNHEIKISQKYLPFVLTVGIMIFDQITKYLVVVNIGYRAIGLRIFGDFIWIIHTKNLGVAFSIGDSLPEVARRLLFIIFPLIVMALVVVYYFKAKDLTPGMRWAFAGILGGGLGNQIDRVFRPDGVVDFLSVKFYGIFGMQRFAAFNVADSSIVVSGILLVILIILQERRSHEQEA